MSQRGGSLAQRAVQQALLLLACIKRLGIFTMQRWQFGQKTDQRWYWRRLNDDSTHLDSSGTFASRLECVADAFEHGYLARQETQSIFLLTPYDSDSAGPRTETRL
ncbi:MAG: hypothetical protein ACXWIP_23085 [Burkholderiales bacterium]